MPTAVKLSRNTLVGCSVSGDEGLQLRRGETEVTGDLVQRKFDYLFSSIAVYGITNPQLLRPYGRRKNSQDD
jgi:hypothetical protein